ncbi:MAG: peptide-methionine (S)-S-oxide reductase MsrA [Burkholderiales bacterium]|nr:peptide-methionine (S)-S-oxide reductase MsrA [Phycisphaerae bacterium]
MDNNKATFAAGCFWGVEAAFRKVPGVIEVIVGYTGGTTTNPTYESVCSKETGHAEAVEVEYDPSRVTFDQLIEVFWSIHNPSARHRGNGPSQYRSAVFYHDQEQCVAAAESRDRLSQSGRLSGEIQTEITPASTFFRAEERHQRYHEKHGGAC